MTISSTTNKVSYTGDGSTTVFPYTFRIDDDDDIRVILITTATGVGVVQTKTTHYTVSGVGATAGGNITMVTAPTSAQKLFLCRSNMPLTQETDYVEYSSFPASTHEAALDKLTMVCQQQQEQIDRSLKAPQNLEISDGSLADTDIVANQVLIINSSATGFDTSTAFGLLDFDDLTYDTPNSSDLLIFGDSSSLNKATVADIVMAGNPSGGGSVPGGLNTYIQYNNAGAFAGNTNFITDGAGTVTATVELVAGGNSTAAGKLTIKEDSDNGTSKHTQTVGDLTADRTVTWPDASITISSFGGTLMDDADASAARTTLGLGTLATQSGTFSGTSSGTNTGDQSIFSTIAVSGQSNVVADTTSDTLTLAAGTNISLTTDASTDTVTITGTSSSLINRIINGGMLIDQWNAAAAATINSTTPVFGVDRWAGVGQAADGVFTLQQSSTVPTGSSRSLKITISTADASIAAGQTYLVRQRIEGYNVSDFKFGTASAATITVSFQFRSSVTGNHSFSIGNTVDLSYPFTVNVAVADTWASYTATVVGPSTGTWNITNGTGLELVYVVGAGSTYTGTANTWANYAYAVTGNVNLIATNAATAYLTNVQVELGAAASAFEKRNIAQELALCQYYFQALRVGTATVFIGGVGVAGSTTIVYTTLNFARAMRTIPTGITVSSAGHFSVGDGVTNTVCTAVATASGATTLTLGVSWTVASGLTQYRPYIPLGTNSSGYILLTGAEL